MLVFEAKKKLELKHKIMYDEFNLDEYIKAEYQRYYDEQDDFIYNSIDQTDCLSIYDFRPRPGSWKCINRYIDENQDNDICIPFSKEYCSSGSLKEIDRIDNSDFGDVVCFENQCWIMTHQHILKNKYVWLKPYILPDGNIFLGGDIWRREFVSDDLTAMPNIYDDLIDDPDIEYTYPILSTSYSTPFIFAIVDREGFLLYPFTIIEREYEETKYVEIPDIEFHDDIPMPEPPYDITETLVDENSVSHEENTLDVESNDPLVSFDDYNNLIINESILTDESYLPIEQRKKLLWDEDIWKNLLDGKEKEKDEYEEPKEQKKQEEVTVPGERNTSVPKKEEGHTEIHVEEEDDEDLSNWIQRLIEIESVIVWEGRKVVRKLTMEEQQKAMYLVHHATKGAFSYHGAMKQGWRGFITQNRLVPWKELYPILMLLPHHQCETILLPFNPSFFGRINVKEELLKDFQKLGYIPADAHVRKEDKYIFVKIFIDSREESFDEDGYGGCVITEYATGIIDDRGRWAYPLKYCWDVHLCDIRDLESRYFVPEEERQSIGL